MNYLKEKTDKLYIEIGSIIREARTEFKVSQQELAEACGYADGQYQISNFENGNLQPPLWRIERMCVVLGMSLEGVIAEAVKRRDVNENVK